MKRIDPLRLNDIKHTTIQLPIFHYQNGNIEDIYQAIYLEQVVGSTPLNMPQQMVVIKETGNGVKTTSIYQLIDSKTTPRKTLNPLEN